MAVWELMAEAMRGEQARGHEWLRRGEIVEAVEGIAPETNRGTIGLQISFHCINDPSKRNSPGLQYRTNPILITDDPTMRGKRYRLITEAERAAFLAHPRDDLEQYSYTQVLEWLRDPATQLAAEADEDQVVELDEALAHDQAAGTALLELHLQDYLFRNWRRHFPDFELYEGARGKEFVTRDPSVGIIDFLCTDQNGNFVVIETKRNLPDRQAVGQILGYMGWVATRLAAGRNVRGLLIAGSGTDSLRMAIAAVPNLELWTYELSFALHPD